MSTRFRAIAFWSWWLFGMAFGSCVIAAFVVVIFRMAGASS